MHDQLIEANKAFFAGDRAETRRLLAEYRAQHDDQFEHVQWLEAHAQDDYDAFIDGLRLLIAQGHPDNRYVRLAQGYLNEVGDLQRELTPPPNRRRLRLVTGITLVLIVAGLLVIFLVLPALQNNQADADLAATATLPSDAVAPTEIVDRSQTLVGDQYTARYNTGIIQLTALEDRSARVRDTRDDSLIEPVPGARFIALEIAFECRSGICRQPPEADVFLQLDNGELAPRRAGVYIDAPDALQPVALGRTTGGWIIFEVPALNRPSALVIRPFADEMGTRQPDILIELPVI